jgi:hypothetical protein
MTSDNPGSSLWNDQEKSKMQSIDLLKSQNINKKAFLERTPTKDQYFSIDPNSKQEEHKIQWLTGLSSARSGSVTPGFIGQTECTLDACQDQIHA